MAERKPHLLVSGAGQYEAFQSRNQGRAKAVPPQLTAQHGQALLQKYTEALRLHDVRQAEVVAPITEEQGIYLEIIGVEGVELQLDKLDNRDFQLRACKKIDHKDVATLFIPEARRTAFQRKITEYLNEVSPKSGKPKNQAFIDSISEIRLASVGSFWTDDQQFFPTNSSQPVWWELWLKKRHQDPAPGEVAQQLAERLGAQLGNTSLNFFDSYVIVIKTTTEQLAAAPELIANLEELRRAKETPSVFVDMRPKEQHQWAADLAERTQVEGQATTAVAILDTGINYHHPLLSQITTEQFSQTWEPSWPHYDQYQPTQPLAPFNDHGSRQAGLAAWGELSSALLSSANIVIPYRIESGRILPPRGNNTPELYGAITVGTAAKLEATHPEYRRIYSLSVTSTAESIGGMPSSWSAEIDRYSCGLTEDIPRLFVISAGNNENVNASQIYWEQAELAEIEDPAQAWNALTVGAFTNKSTNDDPNYAGWSAFARPGEIAPSSRSSVNWGWNKHAPFKPDVVAEGGNFLLSPDGSEVTQEDTVALLTTSGRTSGQIFETHQDTSAACALVSRQAALLMAEYPMYWPETVRALIVHSAEWTDRMWERFGLLQSDHTRSNATKVMLRCVGYGVPDIERARYSANHALTLIVQDTLQPFTKSSNATASTDPTLNEMQLYQLPWPQEALRNLPPELNIKLRITLSYFIEPNPGRKGHRQRYSYASHGLRFAVIRPTQSVENFRAAINKVVNNSTSHYQGVEGDNTGWLLGPNMRTRGSIHSDTWTGSAADLAEMHTLAVHPVGGWWKYRTAEQRWQNRVRFSLVVSIDVPDTNIDIYSEVETQIQTRVQVSN